jgi:hypothetical protein
VSRTPSSGSKMLVGTDGARQVTIRLAEPGFQSMEIHAGSAYVQSGVARRLLEAGVSVSWPVKRLACGEQLAWYP